MKIGINTEDGKVYIELSKDGIVATCDFPPGEARVIAEQLEKSAEALERLEDQNKIEEKHATRLRPRP